MSSHSHEHTTTQKNKTLFIWAASLTVFFAIIEIVYGFISGSLMIIGDGVHMSSDAISLTLSLIATIVASKVATSNRTFGFKRFEPIAAFINGLTLVIIPLYIIYEAFRRMVNPVEIMEKQMLVVGIIGLLINALVGYILSKGNHNINMRSAMLHVFADMITSLSAVIVALAILFFDFIWLDPIGSIVTSFIIIRGGIAITKEAFNILMEGTPDGYSVDAIRKTIKAITPALTVEDVKIWCVNEEEVYTMIRVHAPIETATGMHVMIKERVSLATKIPLEHIYVDVN